MKVWQMNAILQGDRRVTVKTAASNQVWHDLKYWFETKEIYGTPCMDKLNSANNSLPAEFVIAVLKEVNQYCFLARDGWLRSRRAYLDDEKISFLECFKKYGSVILEEVGEYGSFDVKDQSKWSPMN